MIKRTEKDRKNLIGYMAFASIYVLFLGILLLSNEFSDKIIRNMTPITLAFTIAALVISILSLWKNYKTIWGRIVLGYAVYLVIFIPTGIIVFVKGIQAFSLWQFIIIAFIILLAFTLAFNIVKAFSKTKNANGSRTRILTTLILLLASIIIFFLSLCFGLSMGEKTVAQKGKNLLGYYIVTSEKDNQSVNYKRYMFCTEDMYRKSEIGAQYSMEYEICRVYPIARLKRLDLLSKEHNSLNTPYVHYLS